MQVNHNFLTDGIHTVEVKTLLRREPGGGGSRAEMVTNHLNNWRRGEGWLMTKGTVRQFDIVTSLDNVQ